nr:MAG TPA: hypothetical protein [Caudoviricetes sp.]
MGPMLGRFGVVKRRFGLLRGVFERKLCAF